MRITLIILISLSVASLQAQLGFQPGMNSFAQTGGSYTLLTDSGSLSQKWSFNKYAGISAGFGVSGRGNSILSAPIGLQVNRRLTNNLFAIAGVSAGPAYFSLNRSFSDFNIYKNQMGIAPAHANGFGIYQRAELGLMYINDSRTFSISGSFGVDRSSYPTFPANRLSPRTQQQGFMGSW
jgi:hypothetical protein